MRLGSSPSEPSERVSLSDTYRRKTQIASEDTTGGELSPTSCTTRFRTILIVYSYFYAIFIDAINYEAYILRCMLESDNEMVQMFKAMVGLQIGTLVAFLTIGGGIAVFSHQFIMGVLPASEWSPIIGWVIAAGVGYMLGGFLVGIVVMALFVWVFSQ